MPDLVDQIFGGPPPATPTPGSDQTSVAGQQSLVDQIFSGQVTSAAPRQVESQQGVDPGVVKLPKQKIYSGGTVHDIFDMLGTVLLTYPTTAAVTAAARGENPLAAAAKTALAGLGVGEADRPTYEDVLADRGMKPGIKRTALGLVMDIALDPAWVVTPAKLLKLANKSEAVAKVTGAIGKTVAESKVGKTFTSGFVYPLDRKGVAALEIRPGFTVEDAADKMAERLTSIAKEGGDLAKGIASKDKAFQNFAVEVAEAKSPIERAAILQVGKASGVDGTALLNDFNRAITLQEEVLKASAEGIGKTDAAIERVVKELAGPKEVREAFKQELLPQILAGNKGGAKEIADIMEGVTPFGFQVAQASVKAASHVARLELFQDLLRFSSTEKAEGITRKLTGNKDWYGVLAGRFVPDWLGDLADILGKPQGKWAETINETMGFWKGFKTIFSPAAGFRQLPGNMLISTALGPMPIPRLLDSMPKGLALLLGKGDPEKLKAIEMLRAGEGSFPQAELNRMFEEMSARGGQGFFKTMKASIHAASQPASSFYQFWDRWSKASMISWGIDTGMTARESVRLANATLMNYSRVPKAIAFARSNGIVPFASFTYFATRGTARAIWSRPAGLGQISKAIDAVERQNPDLPIMKAAMSPWQKQFGQVLINLNDKNGNRQIFNGSYMLPFQSAASAGERGILGELGSSIPLLSLASALTQNRDPFSDREIVPREEMYGSEARRRMVAVKHIVNYVYQFALPSWAPSIVPFVHPSQQVIQGGYAFRNFEDTVTKRPDFFGETKGWWQTAMGEVLGLKTKPFHYEREQAKRVREYDQRVKSVTDMMEKVGRDSSLSDDRRSAVMEHLQKDLMSVHQDWVLSQGGDLDQ